MNGNKYTQMTLHTYTVQPGGIVGIAEFAGAQANGHSNTLSKVEGKAWSMQLSYGEGQNVSPRVVIEENEVNTDQQKFDKVMSKITEVYTQSDNAMHANITIAYPVNHPKTITFDSTNGMKKYDPNQVSGTYAAGSSLPPTATRDERLAAISANAAVILATIPADQNPTSHTSVNTWSHFHGTGRKGIQHLPGGGHTSLGIYNDHKLVGMETGSDILWFPEGGTFSYVSGWLSSLMPEQLTYKATKVSVPYDMHTYTQTDYGMSRIKGVLPHTNDSAPNTIPSLTVPTTTYQGFIEYTFEITAAEASGLVLVAAGRPGTRVHIHISPKYDAVVYTHTQDRPATDAIPEGGVFVAGTQYSVNSTAQSGGHRLSTPAWHATGGHRPSYTFEAGMLTSLDQVYVINVKLTTTPSNQTQGSHVSLRTRDGKVLTPTITGAEPDGGKSIYGFVPVSSLGITHMPYARAFEDALALPPGYTFETYKDHVLRVALSKCYDPKQSTIVLDSTYSATVYQDYSK